MKKIYYYFTLFTAVVSLASCSLKEDNEFDESASKRSEQRMEEVKKVLYSAPNGWLMEYYGNLTFGGYNVMVKFHNDSVTVGSEKFAQHHVAGIDASNKIITTTSHFKLEQSMGSILSFDDYNETFHYFSMPDNPDINNKADGMYGDFEFRVMKASQDSVILQGKKHGNRIVMTPIPADKTWESYVTEAQETEEFMQSSTYTLTGEGCTDNVEISVSTNGNYRSLVFTYQDAAGLKQTVVAPYIVKKDGFTFYRSVTVNGMVLDGLDKGETQDYFLFRNNPKLQLNSYMPTMFEHITTDYWYMSYEDVGSYAKPHWDAMLEKLKTAGKNNDKITIYNVIIGKLDDNRMGTSMYTSLDQVYWGMTVVPVDNKDDEVKFTQKSTGTTKTDKEYYNKHGWKSVLNCIYGHTFKLITDNQRHPSYITMIDVNEPTNVITIYATGRYFINDREYLDK